MKKYILISIILMLSINALAIEIPFTTSDRDRLIRVETKLDELDKRFEQIDKRFEQIDRRFEQINKRFEQIMTFMWMLVVVFVGIISVTIGFAFWDRRTMIRPFEVKIKALEDTDSKLIDVLRNLSKEDMKLAEVLRGFGLL
ncbi:MAG: hypothetical protein SVR08_13280 [Spirochaetota bacterium]|nr:hypothetical protein [Spirochaetota bacterium]